MQILIGFSTLCLLAIPTAFIVFGIVRIERKVARWLLLDARGWERRAQEKQRCAAEIEGVV